MVFSRLKLGGEKSAVRFSEVKRLFVDERNAQREKLNVTEPDRPVLLRHFCTLGSI